MTLVQRIVIIGAGGAARGIFDTVAAINAVAAGKLVAPTYEVAGFIVDAEHAAPGILVDGRPVLGGFDWLRDHADEVQAVCGVGTPESRAKLVERAVALGVSFCTVIHPAAVFGRPAAIGQGTWIGPGTVISHEVRIGQHVSISANCTIGHDVVIEDFVTVAPGVHVAGNVTLEEGAFVGIGASIVQRRRVGAWSVVGAGSAIMRDVPPDMVVVGVPARVVKPRPPGWQLR